MARTVAAGQSLASQRQATLGVIHLLGPQIVSSKCLACACATRDAHPGPDIIWGLRKRAETTA
eukprot:scaffold53491_cov45-Phaeocystis_antarctica.AAC.1